VKADEVSSVDQTVPSLAPTFERTGVLSGVKVSRAPRPRRWQLSERGRNHERDHHVTVGRSEEGDGVDMDTTPAEGGPPERSEGKETESQTHLEPIGFGSPHWTIFGTGSSARHDGYDQLNNEADGIPAYLSFYLHVHVDFISTRWKYSPATSCTRARSDLLAPTPTTTGRDAQCLRLRACSMRQATHWTATSRCSSSP
jgi:hypothetical protein